MKKPVIFTQIGSSLYHNAKTLLTLKEVTVEGMPPVPFAFSALGQFDAGGAVNGISFMLPGGGEVDYTLIGDMLNGLVIYLDIQRGTYWGDITISVDADPIYNVSIALETLDATQCNSLVYLSFTGTAETDTAYAATITATGGDFSISRTVTINTITEA
jgi:hypothetical protein